MWCGLAWGNIMLYIYKHGICRKSEEWQRCSCSKGLYRSGSSRKIDSSRLECVCNNSSRLSYTRYNSCSCSESFYKPSCSWHESHNSESDSHRSFCCIHLSSRKTIFSSASLYYVPYSSDNRYKTNSHIECISCSHFFIIFYKTNHHKSCSCSTSSSVIFIISKFFQSIKYSGCGWCMWYISFYNSHLFFRQSESV